MGGRAHKASGVPQAWEQALGALALGIDPQETCLSTLLPDPMHAQYLGCDPLPAAPLDYGAGGHW